MVDTILVAEAYTALRGAAMLALAPVGVLVWRRRPPARVLTWIVVGMLLAGQVMAIAVAVVVGQTVAPSSGESGDSLGAALDTDVAAFRHI